MTTVGLHSVVVAKTTKSAVVLTIQMQSKFSQHVAFQNFLLAP